MMKTYRDPKTGAIYTEDGQHIKDLSDYSSRVRLGQISGTPEDISKMPNNYRTPDGGIASRVGSSLGSANKMSNQSQFLEAAKQIIKRKQVAQQPLTEQKAYWRTLQNDTTPFGGQRAPEAQVPGQFTDARMRELSPSDQASIRASRYGATQAHLQGIREEEEYRETRVEDIIQSMTDMLEEKNKIADDEANKIIDALNILSKKQDLGLPITDDDYKKVGLTSINGRTGGSVSWRHNNPGNIKFGEFAKAYGATEGQAATDGGTFAVFPDLETGKQAMRDLLNGKNYKDLTLDQAMKRWSNSGYGAEVLGYNPGNLLMKDLMNDPQITEDLINAMINREGWKEGITLDQAQDNDLVYLSQLTGLSIPELEDLSKEERELLKSTYEEVTKADVKKEVEEIGNEELYKKVDNTIKKEDAKNTRPDDIWAILIRTYSERLTNDQLRASMVNYGFKYNGITNSWS